MCSESLVEGCDESLNPFTVPVAMLLYRVARTLKYSSSEIKPFRPIPIQILLNNCLKLLNEIKYSQVIIDKLYLTFLTFIMNEYIKNNNNFL